MVKNNINCWEYTKCGREPGGKNIDSPGVCPATVQEKYNDINNGINGGRFCWFVENTMCNGEVQTSFLEKFEHCLKCEFYLLVQKQQNRHLIVVRNDLV